MGRQVSGLLLAKCLNHFSLQLIYPLSCEEAPAAEEGSSKETRLHNLDGKLDQLMGVVRLRYLLQRQGGWDSVAEWGDVLSLGQPFSSSRSALMRHAFLLCGSQYDPCRLTKYVSRVTNLAPNMHCGIPADSHLLVGNMTF